MRGRPAKVVPDARERQMMDLYRSGWTLQRIGDEYGLTRERVRQIVTRWGLTKADRPKAAPYAERRRERIDANCRARWGISRAEYVALKTKHTRRPFAAYTHQRMSARRRGVAWEFDFAGWWHVWQASGKWEQRGRGQGYCMARYGDAGPYAPWNVYICTIGQNFSDSYLVDKPRRPRARGFSLHSYKVKDGVRYMVHVPGAPKPYVGALPTREAAIEYGRRLLQDMVGARASGRSLPA